MIANISVNPALRRLIVLDKLACTSLRTMSSVEENDGDTLLARHAKIALDAVNWSA